MMEPEPGVILMDEDEDVFMVFAIREDTLSCLCIIESDPGSGMVGRVFDIRDLQGLRPVSTATLILVEQE